MTSVLKQSRHRIMLFPMNDMDKSWTKTEIDRLDKLCRLFNCGDMPQVDWLDEKFQSYFKKLRLQEKLVVFDLQG